MLEIQSLKKEHETQRNMRFHFWTELWGANHLVGQAWWSDQLLPSNHACFQWPSSWGWLKECSWNEMKKGFWEFWGPHQVVELRCFRTSESPSVYYSPLFPLLPPSLLQLFSLLLFTPLLLTHNFYLMLASTLIYKIGKGKVLEHA